MGSKHTATTDDDDSRHLELNCMRRVCGNEEVEEEEQRMERKRM